MVATPEELLAQLIATKDALQLIVHACEAPDFSSVHTAEWARREAIRLAHRAMEAIEVVERAQKGVPT